MLLVLVVSSGGLRVHKAYSNWRVSKTNILRVEASTPIGNWEKVSTFDKSSTRLDLNKFQVGTRAGLAGAA